MGDQEAFGVPQTNVQCQRLLALLGEKVLSDERHWIHVGQCLYNLLKNRGKELFERYTVPKFRERLEEVWQKFEETDDNLNCPRKRYGLGSLKIMASRYNKQKYDEWIETTAKAAAIGALEETAGMTEIADIVKLMYDSFYICTSVKSQIWWHFNGTIWMKLSGGHAIQQCFSRYLSPIFKDIYKAIDAVDGDADVKNMKKRAADITRGLKNPGFKSVLMTECSQIFLNEDFNIFCDEDPKLLGLPNGVLELEKDRMYLREAYPEDWITLQMGVPYDIKMSWDHVDVKYVMNFFKKVLYKPDLIDFSLKHKGTCLLGGNMDKLLIMNIGTTAHNAKTTCATFDRFVFGRYSGKLPLSVLVVGRIPDQSSATPALAQTKGTRLQQFDEPSRKHEFNGSVAKNLTGNDELWVRQLYGEGFYIKPQFNIIMYGNDAPHNRSDGNDSGMIERTVWVPHDSRFTMEAPESEEEQWKTRTFKADPHINIELHKRGSAYLWILVEYLKKWYTEGLKKPQEVVERTKEYHRENNIYAQYKEERIEVTGYRSESVTVIQLYTEFKVWFNSSYPQNQLPNRADFDKCIKKILGEPSGDTEKRYHGIKVKSDIKNA